MAKVNVPVEQAHRLLAGGPVVLVTASRKGRTDITPVGWCMPISSKPALVAIAIFEGSFIHELIRSSNEFVLNVPSADLVRQVQYCGTHSGRDVDKFEETGLHPGEPRLLEVPYVDECLAHIECSLVDVLAPGDHGVFVGLVVAARAEEEAFVGGMWRLREEKELQPIQHLGGTRYATLALLTDDPEGQQPDERESRR